MLVDYKQITQHYENTVKDKDRSYFPSSTLNQWSAAPNLDSTETIQVAYDYQPGDSFKHLSDIRLFKYNSTYPGCNAKVIITSPVASSNEVQQIGYNLPTLIGVQHKLEEKFNSTKEIEYTHFLIPTITDEGHLKIQHDQIINDQYTNRQTIDIADYFQDTNTESYLTNSNLQAIPQTEEEKTIILINARSGQILSNDLQANISLDKALLKAFVKGEITAYLKDKNLPAQQNVGLKPKKASVKDIKPITVPNIFDEVFYVDEYQARAGQNASRLKARLWAFIEWPGGKSFLEYLRYFLLLGFIIAILKNAFKGCTELPLLVNLRVIEAIESNMQQQFEDNVKLGWDDYVFILPLAVYQNLVRGFYLWSRAIFSPSESFKQGYAIHPAVGILSAAVTVVSITSFALLLGPLGLFILGKVAAPAVVGAVTAFLVKFASMTGLSTALASVANFIGISVLPLLAAEFFAAVAATVAYLHMIPIIIDSIISMAFGGSGEPSFSAVGPDGDIFDEKAAREVCSENYGNNMIYVPPSAFNNSDEIDATRPGQNSNTDKFSYSDNNKSTMYGNNTSKPANEVNANSSSPSLVYGGSGNGDT